MNKQKFTIQVHFCFPNLVFMDMMRKRKCVLFIGRVSIFNEKQQYNTTFLFLQEADRVTP